MTVSRVVNNQPNVRKETRERVLQAIQELSYYPNSAARILSGQKTYNIGIIFPREEYIVTRPYFIELSVKLEQKLREHGYHLFLGSIRKDSEETDFYQLIGEKKVDGLIFFAPKIDDKNLSSLSADRVPFVMVHGRSDDSHCCFVDTDNKIGTQQILDYLYSLGHRRIAFVTGNLQELNARERLETYKKYAKEHKSVFIDDFIFYGDWSLESGYKAFNSLYLRKKRPSAIFFSNDQMALGGIKAAHDKNINIPKEISITGYDDINYASFITPSLTTVNQGTNKIAEKTVEILLDNIYNPQKYQQIILTPQLIIRDSTALYSDDPPSVF